jgi:hypothetical protein
VSEVKGSGLNVEFCCAWEVGMQRHAIALAIALQALQIGAVIRVVMEDRDTAIPAGEDMIEPAGDVESWLAGHGRERSD